MSNDAQKKQIAEKLILNYFNHELRKRNLISDHEFIKMALRIENRKPSARNKEG